MNDSEVPEAIAVSRRILSREGCDSSVSGHVSVRATEGSGFWVTVAEYFDETTPDRVLKFDFDLRRLVGDDKIKVSPAVEFHARLYEARPDVNSIIHTHSHYSKVLATTGQLLGMYGDASSLFLDEQVIHCDDGIGDLLQGRDLAVEVGTDKNVVIVRNHGVIFLGDCLENATVNAFVFEECARVQVEAIMIGGTEHTRAYAERARKVAYQRSVRPDIWAASLRRIQRDECGSGTNLDVELIAARKPGSSA